MTEEKLRLHNLAIRERRQLLEFVYSQNGRQPSRAGLVTLSRAVFLLATRYVMPPEWPGHQVGDDVKLLWEIQWYSDYLEALEELIPQIQLAVRAGRIKPRGCMTRTPLDVGLLNDWLSLDIKKTIAARGKAFWADTAPASRDASWADASAFEAHICLAPDEVATWAANSGIATHDEIIALLCDDKDKDGAALCENELPSVRRDRLSKRANELGGRDKNGRLEKGILERLATEEGVSKTRIKQLLMPSKSADQDAASSLAGQINAANKSYPKR